MNYIDKLFFVRQNDTLKDVIQKINENQSGAVIVVDDHSVLKGTITDGDIRRAFLNGSNLDAAAMHAMNSNPIAIDEKERHLASSIMKKHGIQQLPVIDEHQVVKDLIQKNTVRPSAPKRPNTVFVMAGGLGTRLHPITKTVPKPMVEVNGRPILENIILSLKSQGFSQFYVSLNYLGEMIEDHLKDGAALDVSISYTRETQKMGTGGAISLIAEPLNAPMLVLNGDILTNLDFPSLFDYHDQENADITMCLKEYSFTVPFGVPTFDGKRITGIVEKPQHQFLVNSGIYVLSERIVNGLDKNTPFDMPDLITKAIAQNQKVVGFPVYERWIDIGRMDDLQKARKDDY